MYIIKTEYILYFYQKSFKQKQLKAEELLLFAKHKFIPYQWLSNRY